MKKSSKKGSSVVIMAVIIASIALTAGIVKAASLTVDSLTVGKQGVGGVTFFNGTIINNTTTNGADNPITFGDNVRIDGSVYRGATAGTGDNMPFKIDDNLQVAGDIKWNNVNSLQDYITYLYNKVDELTNKDYGEVVGNLTVDGNSAITGDSSISGDLKVGGSIYKGTFLGPGHDSTPIRIDDNLEVTGEIFAIGGLDTLSYGGGVKISGGELSVEGYVDLGRTIGQPPNLDCAGGSGRMKFDPDDNKLWVCGYGGWKSFSAD